MNTNGKSCYWCGKPATSKEHVPPKCLFPEEKDIVGIYNKTFRNKLITVPACDEHNICKSQDDQYLMVSLAPRFGNNGVAFVHTQTKVRRALERKKDLHQVLGKQVFKINDKVFLMLQVEVDNYRLLRSFEAIGRALYFHMYNKQFAGNCKIVPSFLREEEPNTAWNALCDFCTIWRNMDV